MVDMEQGVEISKKEIMEKLAKLQDDVRYIREHIEPNGEISAWERASDEDLIRWGKKI